MVTIVDIAKEAGVSVSTVSRILNSGAEKRRMFKKETVELICRIAEERGYVPNRMAQTIKTKRSNNIGVTFADIRDPFYTELYVQISDYLSSRGFQVMLFNLPDVAKMEEYREKEKKLLNNLNYWHLDGVIFTYPDLHGQIEAMKKEQPDKAVSLFCCDRRKVSPLLSLVTADIIEPAKQAMALLSRSCHRVIYVGNEDDRQDDRIAIYLNAMKASGQEPWIIGDLPHFDVESAYNKVDPLFRLPPEVRPDGAFCINDSVAVGVIQCAMANGLHIPEDLSVIGVNDIGYVSCIYPSLTTIRMPFRDIAEALCESVLQEIDGEEARRIQIPTELIIRQSTKC